MQEFQSNLKLKKELQRIISSGHMVHAMLFVGGTKESRDEFGMWLAEELLCQSEEDHLKFTHGNSTDFILVEKPEDKESILKDQVLELIDNLSFKPFGEKYVVLVKDAHLMRPEAQNKLLKTLEEPNSPAVFILLSENLESMLSTVNSRCATYFLEECSKEYSEDIKNMCESFCKLIIKGSYYFEKKAILSDMLKQKDDLKKSALDFLDCLEENLEAYILKGEINACQSVKHVEAARKYIKQGQSVAYSLKQMCLRV